MSFLPPNQQCQSTEGNQSDPQDFEKYDEKVLIYVCMYVYLIIAKLAK